MHSSRREKCALRLFVHFFGRRDYSLRPFCAQNKLLLKEVIDMTLNILFFTITIKTRKISAEEALRDQMVREAYEENKLRAYSVHRLL